MRYLKAAIKSGTESVEIKSFILKNGGMGSERFCFGTVYVRQASIVTAGEFLPEKGSEMQIILAAGTEIYESLDDAENCTIAKLYAESSVKTGSICTVTAYGSLYFNDPIVVWDATEETITFERMIQKISDLTGKNVTIKAPSMESIESIVKTMLVKHITKQPTVRAYLAQMAESLMGYAYESVTGDYVICHGCPDADTMGMETNVLASDPKQQFSVGILTCVTSEAYWDDDGKYTAAKSLTASGTGSAEVKYRSYTSTAETFGKLNADVLKIKYTSGTVTLFGNPLLEPCDAVEYTDEHGEKHFTICAGEITQTFDGGLQTEIIAPDVTSDADQQSLDEEYTTEETERQNKQSYVKADQLEAVEATFKKAYAETVKTNQLDAAVANLGYVKTKELEAEVGKFGYVKTGELTAKVAKLGYVTAATVEAKYARLDKANIPTAWIDTAMIGEGVVGTVQIKDGSITDAKIVGLTASKLTAGKIDAGVIEVVNLNAANITVGTINGVQIAPGAIDKSKLDSLLTDWISSTDTDVDKALKDAGLASSAAATATSTANAASSTASSAKSTADSALTAANASVAKVEMEYYKSTSATSLAGDSWSTTQPTWTEGIYIWSRNKTTSKAGTVTYSAAACITGNTGSQGDSGARGNNTYSSSYECSANQSSIFFSDLTPKVSASNPPKVGDLVITPAGNIYEIASVTVNSGTNNGGGFYSTGSSKLGNIKGSQGPQGVKGDTGATGKGVKSIVPQYYLSTSNSTQTGGSWSNTEPTWASGKYIWTRSYITWSDNTTSTTTPILAAALNSANSTANSAVSIANGKTTAYYQTTQPSGGTYKTNDLWFDTDGGYQMYYYNGSKWVATQYGSAAILASAITSGKIAAGAVVADAIAANAVTAGKIATNAVTAGTIAANAVTTDKVAANAITSVKIAADAVTAEKIVAEAVTSAKIATGAVIAEKIATNAVTADKIAAKAVTADKMSVTDLSAISAKIGGWELGTGYIRDKDTSNRYAGIGRNGVTYAFFAGGTADNGSDGKFRVGHDGTLVATNATITGAIKATSFAYSEEFGNGSVFFAVEDGYLNFGYKDSNGTFTTGLAVTASETDISGSRITLESSIDNGVGIIMEDQIWIQGYTLIDNCRIESLATDSLTVGGVNVGSTLSSHTSSINSLNSKLSDGGYVTLNSYVTYRVKYGYCTLVGTSTGGWNTTAGGWINLGTLPTFARPSRTIYFHVNGLGGTGVKFGRISSGGVIEVWSSDKNAYWAFTAVYPL